MDASAARSCERNFARALRESREFEAAKVTKKASKTADDAMDIDSLPNFNKLNIRPASGPVPAIPAVFGTLPAASSSSVVLPPSVPRPNIFGLSNSAPQGPVAVPHTALPVIVNDLSADAQRKEIDPATVPLPPVSDDELMGPPPESDEELEEDELSVKEGKKKAEST